MDNNEVYARLLSYENKVLTANFETNNSFKILANEFLHFINESKILREFFNKKYNEYKDIILNKDYKNKLKDFYYTICENIYSLYFDNYVEKYNNDTPYEELKSLQLMLNSNELLKGNFSERLNLKNVYKIRAEINAYAKEVYLLNDEVIKHDNEKIIKTLKYFIRKDSVLSKKYGERFYSINKEYKIGIENNKAYNLFLEIYKYMMDRFEFHKYLPLPYQNKQLYKLNFSSEFGRYFEINKDEEYKYANYAGGIINYYSKAAYKNIVKNSKVGCI